MEVAGDIADQQAEAMLEELSESFSDNEKLMLH